MTTAIVGFGKIHYLVRQRRILGLKSLWVYFALAINSEQIVGRNSIRSLPVDEI